MSLDESIDTIHHAAKHDPLALLACCLGAVLFYRRHEPASLPTALRLYAAIAELVANQP